MRFGLIFSALFALPAIAALPACSADVASGDVADESDDALSSNPNMGYFVVTHQDTRKCASPACGGFFVKRVNQAKTYCADGTYAAECYVAMVDYTATKLDSGESSDFNGAFEAGHGLIRATTTNTTILGKKAATLKATEAWRAAGGGDVSSSNFYRAGDNGIRCIKAPCPSTSAFKLNANDSWQVGSIYLDGAGASTDDVAAANDAIGTKEGVLVAGFLAFPKCGPNTTCRPHLGADDFYLRVAHQALKSCGGRGQQTCGTGQFCKWELSGICGMADASGTCQPKPEVCYQIVKPVCGCDGLTYGNDCKANAAGVSVAANGACK
ncbi:hypothetical protein BH09MYX1_BH09MYX1_64990 [soil metagenome]